MRFVFYHHEPHGPISLLDLYKGKCNYAGSVLRLRILFWLSEMGNEVHLLGNVEDGELRGVRARSWDGDLQFLLKNRPLGRCVLVLNNPPNQELWSKIRNIRNRGFHIILWAGNPFDWVWLQRVVAGELDRIVCVSHSHREAYRLYPGFEKIEVIYVGADTDLIAATTSPTMPTSDNIVLSTSVPRRSKGIHNLLHAWNYIRQAIPTALLYVSGSPRMHDPNAVLGPTGVLDADLEAEFPHFFRDHPSSTKRAGIELMGALPHREIFQKLKTAKVVVVNTNWTGSTETFCASAIEAQVAGVPVVGAARGSLPEVVANGKTGLLVDREDPAALAEAIITLLKDESLRRRMGAAGPEWARTMADYEYIAKDWEVIARRAFSGDPAPVEPRQPHDLLRRLGYGRARLWVRDIVKRY